MSEPTYAEALRIVRDYDCALGLASHAPVTFHQGEMLRSVPDVPGLVEMAPDFWTCRCGKYRYVKQSVSS